MNIIRRCRRASSKPGLKTARSSRMRPCGSNDCLWRPPIRSAVDLETRSPCARGAERALLTRPASRREACETCRELGRRVRQRVASFHSDLHLQGDQAQLLQEETAAQLATATNKNLFVGRGDDPAASAEAKMAPFGFPDAGRPPGSPHPTSNHAPTPAARCSGMADSIGHLPGLSAMNATWSVRPGWMRIVSRQ